MRYDEIRSLLDTGDVVLHQGRGFISETIRWFTRSPYSHVGMILRSADTDTMLLWESTGLSKLIDIDTGEARQGVQVVALSERVKTYEGMLSVRRLECVRTSMMLCTLAGLRTEMKGRPYEQQKVDLIRAAVHARHAQEDLSSLFCSELVAEAYHRLGILPPMPPADSYVPADFSSERGTIDHRLIAPARLLPEVPLTP